MLSKNDIHAIRHGDTLCIHLGGNHARGKVRIIKRKAYDAKPFETDQEYELAIGEELAVSEVRTETFRGKEALDRGNAWFGHVSYYREQHCPRASILRTLRVGDEIAFTFYPDGHSNGYVKQAGLFADVLYLDVYRDGKRHARWELAISICKDNSARMCRGVYSEPDAIAV